MNAQKGFVIPLVAIIVILAMAGGGCYLYSKNAISNTSKEPLPPIDTSTWKSYSNATYGFKILYPIDRQVSFVDVKPSADRTKTVGRQQIINYSQVKNSTTAIDISAFDLSLQDVKYIEFRPKQNYSVNGLNGVISYYTLGSAKNIEFMSEPINNSYRLSVVLVDTKDSNIAKNDQIVKQMVASVSF